MLLPQCLIVRIESGTIRSCKDFDDVLFNRTRSGDDCVDMVVLNKETESGAESGRDQVACEP